MKLYAMSSNEMRQLPMRVTVKFTWSDFWCSIWLGVSTNPKVKHFANLSVSSQFHECCIMLNLRQLNLLPKYHNFYINPLFYILYLYSKFWLSLIRSCFMQSCRIVPQGSIKDAYLGLSLTWCETLHTCHADKHKAHLPLPVIMSLSSTTWQPCSYFTVIYVVSFFSATLLFPHGWLWVCYVLIRISECTLCSALQSEKTLPQWE